MTIGKMLCHLGWHDWSAPFLLDGKTLRYCCRCPTRKIYSSDRIYRREFARLQRLGSMGPARDLPTVAGSRVITNTPA